MRGQTWLGIVAILISLVSLGVAGLSFGLNLLKGQSDFYISEMTTCRDYRTEVVELHARGLNTRQINSILATEKIPYDLMDEHKVKPGDKAYAETCGSVASLVRNLPPGK